MRSILDMLGIDGFTYQEGFKDGFWSGLLIGGVLFLAFVVMLYFVR
jgi:hypothetical protein